MYNQSLLDVAYAKSFTLLKMMMALAYEEIGSGESIDKRKKMQQLLTHVDEGYYDGVLVMDIDRLGRGEHADWAKM